MNDGGARGDNPGHPMKNPALRSCLVLAFALVLGLMANARAESSLDFSLVNATGYDIKEIYLSPSGQKEWGPNVLKAVLKDSLTLKLSFSQKATAEKWDLKAVYTDGEIAEWSAVKLTGIAQITLHWDKGSSATAE